MRHDDYLMSATAALTNMKNIVSELGDEPANRHPGPPGANSPFQTLTHCLGMLEYWVDHVVIGRESHRDRDAEFRATGPVQPLVTRAEQALRQLGTDLPRIDDSALVQDDAANRDLATADRARATHEAVLLHVLEELCQHNGHMELTRDFLQHRTPT